MRIPAIGPRKFGAARTISALMLREMATTYGTSAGGYVWAVLEPVAGIALLTFIFALALPQPPLGSNFPLFYASGFLCFTMYLNITNKLTVAIRFSKPLLFYPAVRFTDVLIARLLLNLVTEILVMAVVLVGIFLFWRLPVVIYLPDIFLSVAMVLVLAMGIGTLNCFLVSIYPTWERFWGILNRPLFVISTIFFLFEMVPHPYQNLLWVNPLVHVIGQMRKGLFPTYEAEFISPVFVFGLGLFLLALGLLMLKNGYRRIINS